MNAKKPRSQEMRRMNPAIVFLGFLASWRSWFFAAFKVRMPDHHDCVEPESDDEREEPGIIIKHFEDGWRGNWYDGDAGELLHQIDRVGNRVAVDEQRRAGRGDADEGEKRHRRGQAERLAEHL